MRAPSKHNPNRDFVTKAKEIALVKKLIKQAQHIWGDELDTDTEPDAVPVNSDAEFNTGLAQVYVVKHSAGKINAHRLANHAAKPGLFQVVSTTLRKLEAKRNTQEDVKAIVNLVSDLDLTGLSSMGSCMSSLSMRAKD